MRRALIIFFVTTTALGFAIAFSLDGFGTLLWWAGVVVLGAGATGVVLWWRRERTRGWLAWAIYAGVVFLSWTVSGFIRPSYRVVLDNYSSKDLTLELDGQRMGVLRKGTSTEDRWRRGTYEAVLRDPDGKEADRLTLDIPRIVFGDPIVKAYVFNALGAQTYVVENVVYSSMSIPGGERSHKDTHEKWFPADADYVFEDPPSSVPIRVPKGSGFGMTTKTHLFRKPATTPDSR